MRTKKLLLIAAVAVMLVGATSAYGYYETWDGWFNSGELEYFNSPFYYTNGEGVLQDRTYGSVDSFFVNFVTPSTFTCESGEYEGYYIMLWPDASGSKPTGQSGHKEVHEGATWSGKAVLFIPNPPYLPQTVEFTLEGTWDTEFYNDYFNYVPHTPTYSAHWYFGSSDPPGFTGGDGGSEGERIVYMP
ncbi:hypothetical protein CEE36_06375 [candidate division TA06 bacterium B3_TA06]|uniref:Uncharacterized protein n=1 Tax=candidate division TA06 bacterium B3_TA06 TaxID=2012487 RepID=A0A532V6S1_UNCT6|nr:MAG: hypothetical protein CEE36_06375 [candidate division TA06 bacterium B3_TA06]